MKLSGLYIKKAYEAGDIYIDDFDESRLNPNSYNLRLADELIVYDTDCFSPVSARRNYTSFGPLDMKKPNPHHSIRIPEEGLVLQPGVLYLGRTMERTITDKYVPSLEGRSSVGRLGIFVHATAGFGDVGFDGFWTLEISCIQPVRIYAGVDICQIYYDTILGDYVPYKSGKYQKNSGVQPSLMFMDFQKKD